MWSMDMRRMRRMRKRHHRDSNRHVGDVCNVVARTRFMTTQGIDFSYLEAAPSGKNSSISERNVDL